MAQVYERSNIQIKYSLMDKYIFSLYYIYFILKPFYFWDSGLPQISDIIMTILILLYGLHKNFSFRIQENAKKFLMICLLFITYIVVINLVWVLLLGTPDRFILNSLIYVYNFFIVVFIVFLYAEYKEKLVEVTYKSALASVFIQFFFFIVSGGFSGARMTAGFNNPNQLGYYSLLIVSILIYASSKIKVKVKWFILGILASIVLALSSLSKSAIISLIGLMLFYFVFRVFPKISKNKFNFRQSLVVLSILLVLVLIYNTTNLLQESTLIQSVEKRIASTGVESDDTPEARGYNRIIEYPQYWIFGAGEGMYRRFGDHQDREFHSTLGNIQVSYGLIGTILFMMLLVIALRNDRYKSFYIILFLLLYGIAHNGIRNSLFWLLVALIASNTTIIRKYQTS